MHNKRPYKKMGLIGVTIYITSYRIVPCNSLLKKGIVIQFSKNTAVFEIELLDNISNFIPFVENFMDLFLPSYFKYTTLIIYHVSIYIKLLLFFVIIK